MISLKFLLLWSYISYISSCTTFAVGKSATIDGSVMATHTNDGGGMTDPRLVKIPSRDYNEGELRPIYSSPENYPRYVGYDRNAIPYYPEYCENSENKCKVFEPIGYIPQIKHTFSYFEETYGALNEKQVGIVESTCSGVFVASPINAGGKALLSVDQLSQIAMERASTAREAILIMGNLSQTYGFYGESTSFEGGSESLFVSDPNETWAFHILADPTGTSSIWVAARVPDDSVAIVANMFSIRDVDLNDSNNYLGRMDMWEIAEKQGLYKPGDPKDFTATFSDGEYGYKYYSGRRMWGVFRLVSPSANLSAEYDDLKYDKPYPFAVKVDKKLSVNDMMSVLRDWYAGTSYSTGSPDQNLAGGPFGSPDRYDTYNTASEGNWERTISLFRSSDTYIVQLRAWLPDEIGGILWFGPHAAHGTAYVPLLSAMTISPDCFAYGWQGVYNLSASFWVHRAVENIAQIKFSYMIEDIRTLQNKVETKSQLLIESISKSYHSSKLLQDPLSDKAREEITVLLITNAEYVRVSFLELMHKLIYKYSDGRINGWNDKSFTTSSPGYSSWWLDEVGYTDGPPDITTLSSETSTNSHHKLKTYYHNKAMENSQHLSDMSIVSLEWRSTLETMDGYPVSMSKKYGGWNSLRQCIHVTCQSVDDDIKYEYCVKKCSM